MLMIFYWSILMFFFQSQFRIKGYKFENGNDIHSLYHTTDPPFHQIEHQLRYTITNAAAWKLLLRR